MENEQQEKLTQYCGFKIGDEEFAIPVMSVQEVIKPQIVTPVPLAQDFIRGLINLRGQIVTCLSLRNLFGKDDSLDKKHMNIIVKFKESLFSLVVDEITDIIDVELEQLEPAPEGLRSEMRKYVDHIYKKEAGLVILLNVEDLISLNDAEMINDLKDGIEGSIQ